MPDRRKNILVSLGEYRARDVLDRVVRPRGCELHVKMRIADTLQIDHSGLDREAYGLALRAHFDFVVARDNRPLFAIEFDGSQHVLDEATIRRDRLKNIICEQLDFPLLRIDDGAFEPLPDFAFVLEWVLEFYFRGEELDKFQESGGCPPDEFLDPALTIELKAGRIRYPLDPALHMRAEIQRLDQQGRIEDYLPVELSWTDERTGTANLVLFLEVERVGTVSGMVAAHARCRAFRFPHLGPHRLLEQVGIRRLFSAVKAYVAGELPSLDTRKLAQRLREWNVPGCQVVDQPTLDLRVDPSAVTPGAMRTSWLAARS